MKDIKIDKVHLKFDDDGKVYLGLCPECMKMLDEDEMAYGHDCEDESE